MEQVYEKDATIKLIRNGSKYLLPRIFKPKIGKITCIDKKNYLH